MTSRKEIDAALQGLVEANPSVLALSRLPFAVEFLWPEDNSTANEVLARDPVIVVDRVMGSRRIAVQLVKGEIRYWLASDRSGDGQIEIGTIGNVAGLVDLCLAFLRDDIAIAELSIVRQPVHR